MNSDIQAHVREINACNQRGGRMLSLVDLLHAGTVDLPLAAYLAAMMRAGASLLVGARPGGAGKTAVMCALLNFLPDYTAIRTVYSPAVLVEGLRDAAYGRTCYLAHEIGAGDYAAYVWGRVARALFQLAADGHIIASNLHANTLDETEDQLCRENGVSLLHLQAVTLKVFLHVERGAGWSLKRQVESVYESDGEDRLIWKREGNVWARLAESVRVTPAQEAGYARLLADMSRQNVVEIAVLRQALLGYSDERSG